MAYDIYLVERVRQVLNEKHTAFEEKKMMGGLCFMVNGKMCMGVSTDKTSSDSRLMARIGEDSYEKALTQKGCTEFNVTGKAMKGFVFVSAEGIDRQEDLEYWVQLCLDFNPLAKASKKAKRTVNRKP